MLRALATSLIVAAIIVTPVTALSSGTDEVVLQRLSGHLDYQSMAGKNRERIVGQLLVRPRGYAETQAQSMAAIDLPDSSVVSIGASSRVGLQHFYREAGISNSAMVVYDGAIHFAVQHPMGAHANYTFITPTAQIAIRGTEGVIVVMPGETVVACVHGTNNDTVVFYGRNKKMYVPLGMTVRIRGRFGSGSTMSMRRGISGPEFEQFKSIIARNHAMRMRGIRR